MKYFEHNYYNFKTILKKILDNFFLNFLNLTKFFKIFQIFRHFTRSPNFHQIFITFTPTEDLNARSSADSSCVENTLTGSSGDSSSEADE